MAPVEGASVDERKENFELICSLKANSLITVHKYKSNLTGLKLFIVDCEGPIIHGYFSLATEAHDDDGLPHTLEHLIFMGSEKYPYKSVLQLLSNRSLSSGINAWTDTSHTCYTITTAGSEGFLALMPIYLDHILYPTLTNAAFTTEIHHVTKEGEDAGVLYCEIQGIENDGENRSYWALMKELYPGRCGFKSITGGVLKNLRESTNNEKTRNYHKKFYRPENLSLIIVGSLKPDDVIKTLSTFEKTIVLKESDEPFTRPWQSFVPALTESVDHKILYPCDEEDNGMVYIAWRGPSVVKDLYRVRACSCLLKYLVDTSASLLMKKFVQTEDPYASDVSTSVATYSEPSMTLYFCNVPVRKIDLVKGHLFEILREIVDGNIKIDINRMHTVLHRSSLQVMICMEECPECAISSIIDHVLYSDTEEDLECHLNVLEQLKLLEKESEEFWVQLLKEYFVDNPSVTVRGYPSLEEKHIMSEREKDRIEAQREKYGEEGLAKLGQQLQDSITQNEKNPPQEMLTSLPIPSISSLTFPSGKFFTSDSCEQHPKFDLTEVPVQMYIADVKTNFVDIIVLIDTSGIPHELRLYLPLLIESLFDLPVKRGDVLVPYEDIVKQLESDTVSFNAGIGVGGGYSFTAYIRFKVELAKHEQCVSWIRETLYQSQFTLDRLRIIATRKINEASENKRDGGVVLNDVISGLVFVKESNHYVGSVLKQHKFLTSLVEKMDSEEKSEVINDIEYVRQIITNPENIVIHMATNFDNLAELGDPVQPWKNLWPADKVAVKKKLSVIPDWKLLFPSSESPNKNCIVSLGSVESSYLSQSTPSINSFNDKDLIPLTVLLQYLTQAEGPMWRQIRGLGLSYGFSICLSPQDGLLYLTFYRTTNCVLAYKQAKNMVNAYITGKAKWKQILLESAVSSLIAEIVEKEKNVAGVINETFLSYFKQVGYDNNRKLLKLISEVTTEDLNRVGPKYIAALFDPEKTKTAIVCHPTKAEEIRKGFKEMGHDLEVYKSLEESFLSTW